MSRAYNARRKAKRRTRAAESPSPSRTGPPRRRLAAFVPVLLIVGILAVVGVLGFGGGAGISKAQVRQEVAQLLDGIPQEDAFLGSPKAPIAVWVYGDLECPTVKRFVEKYLPSFVDKWVRTGVVRVRYHSLETDTKDERVFFEQEIAALAAGRQDRMWNFLLTFARQQGEPRTDYATEEFIAGIASQVPGLNLSRWKEDRLDPLLSKQVALGVFRAHKQGFQGTPSFSIGYSSGRDRPGNGVDPASLKSAVTLTLKKDLKALQKESREDFPTVKVAPPYLRRN